VRVQALELLRQIRHRRSYTTHSTACDCVSLHHAEKGGPAPSWLSRRSLLVCVACLVVLAGRSVFPAWEGTHLPRSDPIRPVPYRIGFQYRVSEWPRFIRNTETVHCGTQFATLTFHFKVFWNHLQRSFHRFVVPTLNSRSEDAVRVRISPRVIQRWLFRGVVVSSHLISSHLRRPWGLPCHNEEAFRRAYGIAGLFAGVTFSHAWLTSSSPSTPSYSTPARRVEKATNVPQI